MRRKPTLEEWLDDGRYQPEKLSEEDREAIEEGNWRRAGGGVICSICSFSYSEHRPILGANFITKLCDGSYVKL